MMQANLIIAGDSGVGKTTYLQRHLTGDFTYEHIPTIQNTTTLAFSTTHGPITFTCYEGPLIPKEVKGAILMFDRSNVKTYTSLKQQLVDLTTTYGPIPIVIVGNKIDRKIPNPKQLLNRINQELFPLPRNNVTYYDVSAKSNYNFEKPFCT